MRRRQFIMLLGGAAAWPLAARAQQSERIRRVGVLMHTTSDEPDAQARFAGFLQAMQAAGWEVGRNLRIEARWSAGDVARLRQNAPELVALGPDVILAGTGPTSATLLQTSRSVPIVFAQTIDPVGSGVVESMSRPGGNITGFTQFDYDLAGKWLELLKEFAPQVKRVGVLRDFGTSAGAGQWAVIQAFSRAAGVELSPIDPSTSSDIERGITKFGRSPNGGLIVTATALSLIHRELIVSLAGRERLPALYAYRSFVTGGGLASYGANLVDLYRLAASYVDRILKGEKPADLPVQAPTKYELVLNLKTAKALGLDVPPTLLARADEVIMTSRRAFISALGGAAASVSWPPAVRAQQVARIGVLNPSTDEAVAGGVGYPTFVAELRRLGFSEGHNLVIEHGRTDQGADTVFADAAAMVRANAAVIVASGAEQSLKAAKAATSSIPIVVLANNYDPIARGYVASLARPGGNITGVFYRQPELTQKRVELLVEAFPGRTRLAMLWDVSSADSFAAAERTAKSLNLKVEAVKLDNPPYDFDAAFRSVATLNAQMLLVVSSRFFAPHRAHLAELAIAHQLPAMFNFGAYARAGGLFSYGVDPLPQWRRAASFVGKILRGAKPMDLPMDNVTKSAELLGCNRATVHRFIRDNPELHDFRYHVIGAVLDRAQEVVFDAVDSRDVQTSLKVLGTLHPAWKNKQTVEHQGTVQHSLAGQDVMTAEKIAAMSDADLKKMIAVREAERADARTHIARIEAAIAERAAEGPVAGPGTGPETESGGPASDV